MDRYDEDLNENGFFVTLKTDYEEVYIRAVKEGWIICVPRTGALPKYALTQEDFLGHILIPSDELPETHFRTLTDKNVLLKNSVFVLEEVDKTNGVSILFDETFYDSDLFKYKVYCIESPLCVTCKPHTSCLSTDIVKLTCLRDCIDFLYNEFSGQFILEKFDLLIQTFLSKWPLMQESTLDNLRSHSNNLFSETLKLATSDERIHQKTENDSYFLDVIKIAIESYVLHGVYKKLLVGITGCTAFEDSRLNRKIRNLSELHIRDLDINSELSSSLTRSKAELSTFGGYTTPLGKLECLKKALSSINSTVNGQTISTDEVLPIIVFLIVKSNIANWYANITYLKLFRFSSNVDCNNEHNFNISSLEAAVEHIQSGILFGSKSLEADLLQLDSAPSPVLKSMELTIGYSGTEPLALYFQYARSGKVKELRTLMSTEVNHFLESSSDEVMEETKSQSEVKLCHPLCSCDKCEKLVKKPNKNLKPTVGSRDDRGLSGLHVACIYGKPNVVDFLLSEGAEVDMTDLKGATSLHYAAQRGHQNAILLLLHGGADINKQDNERNIALHLASQNGHETCVKAILFYAESVDCELNINAQNSNGDTPLHLACRWGYISIVELLLERIQNAGLSMKVLNNRRHTPIDCAHNHHISKMILDSKANKEENSYYSYLTRTDFKDASSINEDVTYSNSHLKNFFKSKLLSRSSTSQNEIKTIEKLTKAISNGDVKLACYYLKIDEESCCSSSEEAAAPPKELCHPLCQCPNCCPDMNKTSMSNKRLLLINGMNVEGLCALHIAILNDNLQLCKILLKNGANTDVQCIKKGLTPLHIASKRMNLQIMKLLLANHAQPDIIDVTGNTALHYCCASGFIEAVEILLNYGASKNINNKANNTPVEEAEFNGHLKIVEMILEKGF